MDAQEWLAEVFEEHRGHLHAVAARMLGPGGEADDAVQETWLRLSRSDTSDVANLRGWLTTVVARICLDALRARSTRREVPGDPGELADARVVRLPTAESPEEEVVLADSVGLALLVVLDTLSPAERLAFVLHDLFAVPFEEIAPLVGRTPTAARKLASRARQRVQEAGGAGHPDRTRQRRVVEAFLAASRGGDFDGLLALLDPEAVIRADAVVVGFGAEPEVRGAAGVARTFAGRAKAARLALVDGEPGAVWSVGGSPRVVFLFELAGDRVVGIDLVADPQTVEGLDVEPLE